MKRTLEQLVRPNIWMLTPHGSTQCEHGGSEANIFLDANENPYNKPLNRYPDPLQRELKEKLSQIKQVPAGNIFLSNGCDEAIDLVYRIFCEPKQDNVVAIEPTYGMYKMCADINNTAYKPVLLDECFQLSADKLLAACNASTKVIWLCSPNNPTGNDLHRDAITEIIQGFDGIVVLDEAYSDFSSQKSFRTELTSYPNLIILNTMSLAWGCAGIRLGMAFASEEIVNLFNKVKQPYNISSLTQEQALKSLQGTFEVEKWVTTLLQERRRMVQAFAVLPQCVKVYPTSANFFLAKMKDAQSTYRYLLDKGIVVRDKSHVTLCHDCLRVTIGTKTENNELLAALRQC